MQKIMKRITIWSHPDPPPGLEFYKNLNRDYPVVRRKECGGET